ncbi:MAG: prolyl oligopeptidase family serine peptidase [Parvularcula sp.]
MKTPFLAFVAATACALGAGCENVDKEGAGTEKETPNAMTSSLPADPYLWLEEVEGERALDWVREQNARSLAELESDPRYQTLFDEAMAILTSDERIPDVSLRGGYAYNFWRDDEHVRGLWRRMPVSDYVAGSEEWDVLLDVDALAEKEGENWVYAGVDCLAPDYDRCLMSFSRGGSDAAVQREFRVDERAFVADGFTLPEAKTGVAWMDQDTVLVSTDTGEGSLTESGYPRVTRRWQRGQSLQDSEVVFEGEKEDVGIWPFSVWSDGAYVSGVVRSQTFYDKEYFLFNEAGDLEKLPLPLQADLESILHGKIILTLNEPWAHGGATYPTGAVISYDPATDETSSIFLPEDRVAVKGVATSEDAVFITVLDHIQGRLLRYDAIDGVWKKTIIPMPDNGVVSLSAVEDETGDALVYYENPTTPDTVYYVKNGEAPKAIRSLPAFYNTDGVVVEQHEVASTDGEMIPYFVMAKKDVLAAGPSPTIQYGYGGFRIPILPNYSATTGKMWLENGGVYVIANIRGGGEFGPDWHAAGLKTKRQLIYDDFYAVSEDLIKRGITTPEQLGILGGSNGGLLMGVALTQRPDLYKAIGIGVPLLDMMRYDQLLAGASWVIEYGDPSDPVEGAFLRSISPYHNLKPDTDHPRPFFFTSTKDDRVHPGHARKMARKMAEYGYPFLYYENIEGGHGAAANQEQMAKRLALQYVYFARELGLDW